MRALRWFLIAVVFWLCLATEVQAQTGTASFKLSWIDNANNEEGQYIYRDGTRAATVGANIVTYTDTVTGAWGQNVCYAVSAFNHQYANGTGNIQESPKSNSACGSIPVPSNQVPAAPGGLTTEPISTSQIQLRWEDHADNETGIIIAKQQNFAPRRRFEILLDEPDVVGYTDVGLRRGRSYCYSVRAVNDFGESEPTAESCAQTLR